MSWKRVIGRVAFTNCDPLFYGLDKRWSVLPAPPAWLTGHLMRRDCLTAPIPTADYAKYSDELYLIPELGIVSNGAVGSVILFGTRKVENMRDIALPSDSSTSNLLLRWLLKNRDLDPKLIETGPDLDSMLDCCDGALLIGDRALASASKNPDLVQLDLGGEWTSITGLPMVFGVFACLRDSPVSSIKEVRGDLLANYDKFNSDQNQRNEVIKHSAERIGTDEARISSYFDKEVRNTIEGDALEGLLRFLKDVCMMEKEPEWLELN